MLLTSIFSFAHHVFYPFLNKSQYFRHIYFVVYKWPGKTWINKLLPWYDWNTFECGVKHHLILSQTTKFRLFHTERVCRRQFWIWWNWQKGLQKVRKHHGKRRNCSWWAIHPFPTVFSKDLYFLKTHQNQGLFGKRLINRLQMLSNWNGIEFCQYK